LNTHPLDIIHEGAGHAPIIANPEYARIRRFGEIGCKAISGLPNV
jgi:phenylalanine-4-hydroxylase